MVSPRVAASAPETLPSTSTCEHHPLSEYGTDLSDRTTGRNIREKVLSLARAGEVVLDFGGLQSITHSFADGWVAVLVSQQGEAWFRDHIRVRIHEGIVRPTLLDAIEHRLTTVARAA